MKGPVYLATFPAKRVLHKARKNRRNVKHRPLIDLWASLCCVERSDN